MADDSLLLEEKELGIYEDTAVNCDDLLSETEDAATEQLIPTKEGISNDCVERNEDLTAQVVKETTGASVNAVADPSPEECLQENHAAEARNLHGLRKTALELLHRRCVTVAKQTSPFYQATQSPLVNDHRVSYVTVNQCQPIPMEPLKAWKGYNGNLYFQPITIKRARISSVGTVGSRTGLYHTKASRGPIAKAQTARTVRGTAGAAEKPRILSEQEMIFRQMSLLDKRAVMSRLNKNIHEDLAWIRGQESVGSLIEEASPGDKARAREKYKPEKIRKGSVARTVMDGRLHPESEQPDVIAISGGKFHAPLFMSPLLRTTTQYSQSTQRITTSSPDMYNNMGNYDRLPPLEQFRASLRHIDNSSTERHDFRNNRKSISIVEKPPAYVKYSRDVTSFY